MANKDVGDLLVRDFSRQSADYLSTILAKEIYTKTMLRFIIYV